MNKSHYLSHFLLSLWIVVALASPACNCDGEHAGSDASQNDASLVYDGGQNDATLIDGSTSDTSENDASSIDANADDAGQSDAASLDSGSDAGMDAAVEEDAATVPAAPTITGPDADSEVSDSITVTGTGEPGATVTVEVSNANNDVLGSASGSVDSNGDFSVELSYSGADDGAHLSVSVSQSNSVGRSEASSVEVINKNLYDLGGIVSQAGSVFFGDKVYVRLYDSPDEILHYIDEQVITVSVGSRVPDNTSYNFRVANGSYHVRAFRDSFGPMSQFGPSPLPDGQPTLGSDDQAPGKAVVISNADSINNDLVMNEAQNQNDRFAVFLAYTLNASAEAVPPYYQDGQNWVPGTGLCGGYYLRFDAWRIDSANPVNMTLPLIETPDGSTLTMLSDSGCSETVHDNSNNSYDRDEDPNSFSYGIPNPTDALAGDYTFYYKQKSEDLIHVQVDHFDSMQKLGRRVIVTSPTGASANANMRPTITWEAIANAGAYKVELHSLDNTYTNAPNGEDNVVTTNSYNLANPLPALDDNMAYRINIIVWDTDPTAGGDFDALAFGTQNTFVTDADGNDSVTISGTIVNNSSASGRILLSGSIRMHGDEQQAASLWLPDASTTSYQLVLPKASDTEACDNIPNNLVRDCTSSLNGPCDDIEDNGVDDCTGSLLGFIDIDESGQIWSMNGPRHNFVDSKEYLDLRDDVSDVDLHFTEPVLLSSPIDGASDVTVHAHFQWQDYASTAAGYLPTWPWSYIIYFSPSGSLNGDLPENIWGLPATATNFDLANPPSGTDSFDVVNLASSGAKSSADTLTTGDWQWAVMVMECDYQAYVDNTDADNSGTDDYAECLQAVLGSNHPGYASSGEWSFSVQ